jgi:hypothetical protein
MVDVLEGLDPGELDRRSKRWHDVENMEAGTVASTWFDVDATVALAEPSADRYSKESKKQWLSTLRRLSIGPRSSEMTLRPAT